MSKLALLPKYKFLLVVLPSSERPVMESGAIGRVKPGLVGGPEPSVDFLGEKIGAITTIKITQTARSPNVFDT